MNSMELANGMMYVDSVRMQHQQLNQMLDYEYFYKNKKMPHSYKVGKEQTSPICPPYQEVYVYGYEDIVEFPIESYNVLKKETQAVLSIEQNFLVFSSSPTFDWEMYRERILKGLSKVKESLVTFVYSDDSILQILEDAGFKKEKIDKKKGKTLYRLSLERG